MLRSIKEKIVPLLVVDICWKNQMVYVYFKGRNTYVPARLDYTHIYTWYICIGIVINGSVDVSPA